ncbi:rRNA biogenesis protein rrp36 [Thecaphora frezii]
MRSTSASSSRTKPPKRQPPAPVFEQDPEDDLHSLDLPTEDEDEEEEQSEQEEDQRSSDDDLEATDSIPDHDADEDNQERRYAQFVDEDELEDDDDDDEEDEGSDDESEEDGSESELESDVGSDEDAQIEAYTRKQQEKQLKEQMKNIPFSALVKARKQLGDDSDASDNDDAASIGLSDLEPDEFEADRQRLAAAKKGKKAVKARPADLRNEDDELETKRREVKERLQQLRGRSGEAYDSDEGHSRANRRREHEERERKELEKRANKHAPTEMSSRKPVSRRRNVVETASIKTRDPRFDSLSAGATNADLFSKSYSFLPEMFNDELQTLKAVHQKLRKQEMHQAGPKAKSEVAMNIRAEREKVEKALRRAEGLAGERERRRREAEVKRKIKRQNKERVEKGLNPFYVKKSEQRAMLLKEKYDKLAGGEGGSDAASGEKRKSLKKALERRRKKNVQKERKDMPVGMALGLGGAAMPKRKRDQDAAATAGAGPSRSGGAKKARSEDGAPARKRGRRG